MTPAIFLFSWRRWLLLCACTGAKCVPERAPPAGLEVRRHVLGVCVVNPVQALLSVCIRDSTSVSLAGKSPTVRIY